MATPAIIDPDGSWTAAQVRGAALAVAAALGDRPGARVALLCTPGHDFMAALLGSWQAGCVAVPLDPSHPDPELRHHLDDAGVSVVLASVAHAPLGRRLSGSVVVVAPDPSVASEAPLAALPPGRPAMLIYTSGTTGRPKGAVHTHGSLAAQVEALRGAWGWTAEDRILLVLPLHHVHGIMAVCLCAWASGACCEAPGRFDALATWERLASGDLTLFMAVPTIYARLIAAWEGADEATRQRWTDGVAGLRLMVSGSAALPVSTLARWQEISRHVLLERYGMTEFGLALSNTLTRRVPGHVGEPLPGFEIRLVDEGGADVPPGEPGELLVRGPALFDSYWNRPAETAAAWSDGWFRTGDVAVRTPDGYRLLGRSSVDIIKSGGEKVSALEIEEAFRSHAEVVECAVVGVPDPEWGERVALAYVSVGGATLDPAALRTWGKERLAAAKVPSRFLRLDDLPRNAMGKVTKPAVVERFTTVDPA